MAQPDRLLVAVLGNPRAGKSTTWNTLFGQTVKTLNRPRLLELRRGECVEVFLVSGSAAERHKTIGQILRGQSARIVLCSIQYKSSEAATINYFADRRFQMYVQWLNPGYKDTGENWDKLGLINQILSHKGLVSIRNGKLSAAPRVQRIREYIYGWAVYHGLIQPC